MSKLVVYFSYGGVTRRAGEKLAKDLDAATFEIKAKIPYTRADVNWQDDTSRNVREYKNVNSRPEIETLPDISDVDEIWVGYPIWWYTHPRIINTFFDQADLTGKRVHLFATSSSTGIQGSLDELRATYPGIQIVDGKRI